MHSDPCFRCFLSRPFPSNYSAYPYQFANYPSPSDLTTGKKGNLLLLTISFFIVVLRSCYSAQGYGGFRHSGSEYSHTPSENRSGQERIEMEVLFDTIGPLT